MTNQLSGLRVKRLEKREHDPRQKTRKREASASCKSKEIIKDPPSVTVLSELADIFYIERVT